MWRSRTALLLLAALALVDRSSDAQSRATDGLTAVPGIKVGHHTLTERPTGCTVILTEAGTVAGVDVRGAAPGTRETDLLSPVKSIQRVHAVMLAGGSAFGLDAASGVMRYLEEAGSIDVPIVPAAILIDLVVGGKPQIRPTADCGYAAARAATSGQVTEGNVGAGAGATVGKFAGASRAMKGGLGTAAIASADGLIVAALVAVNAFGDIVDPASGQVVAGVRTADGKGLADVRVLMRGGAAPQASVGANSTIGVVATNAALTKAQATKVAQMAHDGFARTIVPVHTPADGDTIFALATAAKAGDTDVLRIGALAAEAMSMAVLRAVRQAHSIPGYPAAIELKQ